MAWFEVIIFKNQIKGTFKVEDVSNSNEKEGTTNEISLSLDLIKVKDGNNFYFRNLAYLPLFGYSNTTVLELQTLLFLFFPKSALPNWGCGLSKDAAYTWTFTVVIGQSFVGLQGSKFIFGFGSTCATRCKFLGAQLKFLGTQLQILGAPTQKDQNKT